MKSYSLILIALSLFLGSCGHDNNVEKKDNRDTTIYVGPDIPVSKSYKTTEEILKDYKMVWNDEFEGTKLNRDKWDYRYEGSVRDYATVSRKAVSLDGEGHLVLSIVKEDDTYYMGMLGTQNLFETTYGYFETRVRLNEELGPQYAFWLQSPDYGEGDPAKKGVEIDIFEYVKKQPEKIHHTIHWDGYGDKHQKEGVSKTIPGLDKGFHTFGLLWTKNEYAFFVDGKRTWVTNKAISKRNEYIILSNGITGWGGDPDQANYPDSALYDYVRVYQPK